MRNNLNNQSLTFTPRLTYLILLVLTSLMFCNGAFSQSVTDGMIEGDKQTQKREETLRQLDRIKKKEKREKAQGFELPLIEMLEDGVKLPKAGEGPEIPVKKFNVSESQILSDHEINGLLSSYEGRDIFLRELYELIAEFNELYRGKGFVTARAVLPPQTIKNGIVNLQLIEGKVGQIRFEGADYTFEWFIANRVGLKEGDLVELKTLEEWLVRYNRLYSSQLAVKLESGKEFGTTDLVVSVEDAQRLTFNMYRDRHGVVSTGEDRTGGIVRLSSLFGFDDPLSFGLTETRGEYAPRSKGSAQGSLSGYLTYSAPITKWGTRLSGTLSHGKTRIIGGSFNTLEIRGTSFQRNATLSHPLYVGQKLKVELDTTVDLNKSRTKVTALTQDTYIRKTSWGLTSDYIGDSGYYSLGLRRYDFHSSEDGVITTKRKVTANLFAYQSLGNGFVLQSKFDVQGSNDRSLPSSEQFALGGQGSVRAYEASSFSGDRGYFASVELQYTIPLDVLKIPQQDENPNIQYYIGLDHGGAFPYRDKEDGNVIKREDFASAAGVGFRARKLLDYGTIGLGYVWGLDGIHRSKRKYPRFQLELSFDF